MNEFLRNARSFTYAVSGVDGTGASAPVNSASDSDGMAAMFASDMAQQASNYQQQNAAEMAKNDEQTWGDTALKALKSISIS